MNRRLLPLLLSLLILIGIVPISISALASETHSEEPQPIVEGACSHDSEEISFEQSALDAFRPTLTGKLYEVTPQRVEDTFDYLYEFYTELYPEEALLMNTGTEKDREVLKTLAETITADCTTDREKAEAVNDWIAKNIDYASFASAYASDTFYRREGNCLSEANLMQYLMRSLGIPAVVGEGWRGNMKTDDIYLMGKPGHAWCFVYVDDQWVLYDPLWLYGGTTDREYMAEWMYFDTTGFIVPVSDEENLPPRLYDSPTVYYCKGRLFIWSFNDPEGIGTHTFQVNNQPHVFKSNQCDGDIGDGIYYLDGVSDKSTMKKGEVYRNSWISYGDYSKNNHRSLAYAHANGEMIYGAVQYFDGMKLFANGSDTEIILAAEGDYDIIEGKFTLRPGYTGKFLSTHYEASLSDPDCFLSWSSETPDIATVDEDGKITCLKEGKARLRISLKRRNPSGSASLLGDSSLTVYISGEERIPDYSSRHIHSYSFQTVLPTCVDGGYTICTCECGDTYNTNFTEPNGHYYTEERFPETCTEDGYVIYTCHCGDSYTEVHTYAKGHDYSMSLTESTCSEGGYKEYECWLCGHAYVGDYTGPLGHNYVEYIVPATCYSQGYTLNECSRCKDSFNTNYTEMIPHTMGMWFELYGITHRRNCEFCGYYETRTAPPPVIKASNVTSSGKIKLSWEAIPGAEKYKVYRATSKNGKYSLMKTVTGTSYTNTSAKAGTLYYYKIAALDSGGVTSEYSNIVSRTCDYARPEVTASNVASSGKIKLTWKNVEGATSYKVYRATSKNGEYTLMKTVKDGTSYTNSNAVAGKMYYYKVKACGTNSAAESAFSAVDSRTCDLKRPTVAIKTSSGKPYISWSAITGATKYKIYRSTSKSGTYSLVKTTTSKYWKDTTAKKGKTYYYKVVAVHKNSSANSAKSEVKYIKCTK